VTLTAAATADRTALLASALMLAEQGMHVFPLKPGSKAPALHHGWEERATTDAAKIRRCWGAGPFNIGVACGPSGLLVVDCDTPKDDTPPSPPPFNVPGVNEGADVLVMLAERYAEPFPWGTFHVVTGRGGMHLYFRQPGGEPLRNTAGRLGWLIDTRGAGGYVVGPESIVDGRAYRGVSEPGAVPLPGWLTRLLTAPKQRLAAPTRPPGLPSSSPRRAGAYAEKVLREEIAKVLAARPGTRNDTLNAVAFNLGKHAARGTVPADLAWSALEHAAEALGGDTAKSAGTAHAGFTAGQEKGI
jgi:hypothetical protein